MAELRIRKGSFLIQVEKGGEVVFAISLASPTYDELDRVVVEVVEEEEDKGGGKKDKKLTPHPEIKLDIRDEEGKKLKALKSNWDQGTGKYGAWKE